MALGAAGLVVGGLGTAYSARQNRRATETAVEAARFRPFNVNGPAGQVSVGADGNVNLVADPDDLAMRNRLRAQGFGALYSGVDALSTQPLDGGMNVLGNVRLNLSADRGLMQEAQRLDPNALNPAINRAGNIAALGLQNLDAATAAAAQQGAMGREFLTAGAGTDINALAAERLAQLNSLAHPAEDRMAAQLGDRLFGSGRNATTGGAQQFGELLQAQERAETERALAAMNFATGEQNRLLGLGQSLTAGGQGLALNAMTGASAAQNSFAGLVGQRNAILAQRFQEMLGANELGMSRGLARGNFQLTEQAQRFGQQAARAENIRANILARMGAGEGMLGLSQQFDPFNQLMQQAGLSATLSSAASGAGANVGNLIQQGNATQTGLISSMFGGMMSGLMNGS